MNAFEIMEKELSECKRLQALKSNKLLNDKRPRMQQDINIINGHDSDESSNVENEFVSELKQAVESKNAFAENQRKIIENQNDKIFKLNDGPFLFMISFFLTGLFLFVLDFFNCCG